MALTYKEILRAVRFKERDNDEIKFSDYEIKEATNEAIRYISNSLADSNADFNEKQKFYDEREINEGKEPDERIKFQFDGVELPEDFLTLIAVKGKPHIEEMLTPCLSSEVPNPWEYKVMGDKIYVGAPHFCLVYKAGIQEVATEDDDVELPYFVKDYFVALVRRILTGADGDIMRQAQDDVVNALIPKRRYRNAKIRMPFKINSYWHRW